MLQLLLGVLLSSSCPSKYFLQRSFRSAGLKGATSAHAPSLVGSTPSKESRFPYPCHSQYTLAHRSTQRGFGGDVLCSLIVGRYVLTV
jgi:hypothetical protein